MTSPYDKRFYDAYRTGMMASSEAVLRELAAFYAPSSVVDIGCGQGAWLKSAAEQWETTVTGFDGPWVDPDNLMHPDIDFHPIRLEQSLDEINGRYDLCISMEVAEHLPPSHADQFVETLTRLAPIVLFSAAIPEQGGTDHFNEQWPSYWAARFRQRGFEPVDLIRSKVWGNKKVKWWYRQNTILYVQRKHPLLQDPGFRKAAEGKIGSVMDLVHPSHFLKKMARRD